MTYTPPKVWTWDSENGGQFANINRPIAGATHDKTRDIGKHPHQLYSLATPNGVKVTIMFEELLAAGHSGAEYDAWLINIGEGDQFSSAFVDVNPNSKIPALYDETNGSRVFESGAILLYLAEKFDAFLPKDPKARTETLNWLFWLQGSAPYLGGGFGHFYAYAAKWSTGRGGTKTSSCANAMMRPILKPRRGTKSNQQTQTKRKRPAAG